MSMSLEQALGQLRSDSREAVAGVVRYVLRGGFGRPLPAELAEALAERLTMEPSWDDASAAVITDFPSGALASLYRKLLEQGGALARARALERVPMWLEARSVRFEDIEPALHIGTTSESVWTRFLSWLQLARFSGTGDIAWTRAAEAVVDGDEAGTAQSIRGRVTEITTPTELEKINRELVARASPALIASPWPRPRGMGEREM